MCDMYVSLLSEVVFLHVLESTVASCIFCSHLNKRYTYNNVAQTLAFCHGTMSSYQRSKHKLDHESIHNNLICFGLDLMYKKSKLLSKL